MTEPIDRINRLSPEDAAAELKQCCGSRRWIARMVDARPFADAAAMHAAADAAFDTLVKVDWLECFRAHPRIGDRKALRARYPGGSGFAAAEQAGALAGDADTLDALTAANRTYEERFGHIFIVCATGRTAQQMLAMLWERLGNEPDEEIEVAAGEQRRITHLRIDKLLGSG